MRNVGLEINCHRYSDGLRKVAYCLSLCGRHLIDVTLFTERKTLNSGNVMVEREEKFNIAARTV